MHCSTLQANRPNTRTLHINFGLDRSPIVQLFTVMLMVGSIGFLVLFWFTAQLSNLAMPMAAFFLSLWSLRRILEPLIKTFPTLFDYGIMTICILAVAARHHPPAGSQTTRVGSSYSVPLADAASSHSVPLSSHSVPPACKQPRGLRATVSTTGGPLITEYPLPVAHAGVPVPVLREAVRATARGLPQGEHATGRLPRAHCSHTVLESARGR
jgi:hypothetical protein